MTACTCLACGACFNSPPGDVERGSGKYCSMACRSEAAGYRRQVRNALPGTIADIRDRTGVREDTVRDQLVSLQKRGEAHAGGLVPIPLEKRGRGTPKMAVLYAAGAGGDPEAPVALRAQLAYYSRKLLLEHMPGSQAQLVERTGHSQGGTSRMLAELHAAGKCHIIRWRRAKRGTAYPVYAAGPGKDSVCNIRPMTSAERSARYLKKLDRLGLLEQLRKRNAADQRAVTLRKRGDPLINALFGKGRAATKEGV